MGYEAKRGLFIGCVMFPVLMLTEYFGYNTYVIAPIVAGISSGISVILFPDPKHLERLEREKQENADRS